MANCSNLLNTQSISLTAGTLTAGFCHTNLQTTYEEFISKTTAATEAGGTTNVASFTAGDDTPVSGDQGKLWFKQNPSDCNAPFGWYHYNAGASPAAWEVVPNPLSAIYDASDTEGAVAYHDGTKWTVLAPGTAGQVLQSNGTSAPSATTSKVLVTVAQIHTVKRVSGAGSGGAYSAQSQLKNGSSVIWGPIHIQGSMQDNYGGVETGNISITYLHEPASTSSQTYSMEHAIASNAQTSTTGAGTITLTEIK